MRSSLRDTYPGIVCDLDGVVYRGAEAVPHAIDELTMSAVAPGGGVVYATNNASRTPAVVAAQLRELGLALDDTAVVNSSAAGAQTLREGLPAGARVLAIGGDGVSAALSDAGLVPVSPRAAEEAEARTTPVAVLQGYGAQVRAGDLAQAAYAIQGGARWVVTNDDLTLPTDRGTAPGNGTLVAAVRAAVDVDPEVVGKPGPLMYRLAARQLGTSLEHTLAIGDRLETDIAGARAAGMDSLLVLTGVHRLTDVVAAPPELRPRYLARDLRCLSRPYPEPFEDDGRWHAGSATAEVTFNGEHCTVEFDEPGTSTESGAHESGTPEDRAESRWRAGVCALWAAIDGGRVSAESAVRAVAAWQ